MCDPNVRGEIDALSWEDGQNVSLLNTHAQESSATIRYGTPQGEKKLCKSHIMRFVDPHKAPWGPLISHL